MKKQIPALKAEHEWLKECYSQCLQQSVLNLSQAFQNFFEGRAKYPNFKSKHHRQSVQFPQNVKVISESAIKFPGLLGTIAAKIHRPIEGQLKTVTVSKMPDGKYFASLLVDVGWGQFCTMLKYKAEFEGKVYLEIGRFFPSSHPCSNTLLPLEKMDLSIRSFVCPHCSERHDRDVNAAINIRNEGLRISVSQGLAHLASGSGASALGRDVKTQGRKAQVYPLRGSRG
ncbi:MAG: transposase [Thermostichus sp. HHBFW_bins_43]